MIIIIIAVFSTLFIEELRVQSFSGSHIVVYAAAMFGEKEDLDHHIGFVAYQPHFKWSIVNSTH